MSKAAKRSQLETTMTPDESRATGKVKLGSLEIKTKITVKNLRRMKSQTNLDFTVENPQAMMDFFFDPCTVSTVCFALYEDQIVAAGLDEEGFEDLCDVDAVNSLRDEVDKQMRSFSSFWKTISTEMEGLRTGSTDLIQRALQLKQLEASGRSSLPPPVPSGST